MVSKPKKTTAKKKTLSKSAKKTVVKKKTTAKKTTVKKAAVKKTTTKKTTLKKAAVKKTTTKKTTLKKAAVKKATVKKTTAKKTAAKAKVSTSKKTTTKAKKIIVKKDNTSTDDVAVIDAPVPAKEKAQTEPKLNITPTGGVNLTEQLPDIDPDAAKTLPGTALGIMGIPPYTMKADEEYMNETQQQHFRAILQAWRASLMEEVDRIVNHMQDESASFPDPSDRATQEEEFGLALRARDRERKLIAKINEALESISQDEYGFCESCGIDIGIRRLEARPTATLCIDCKTLDEIRERQMKQ